MRLSLHPLVALMLLPFAADASDVCDPDVEGQCPPQQVLKWCPVVPNGACSTGKAYLVLALSEPPPFEHTQVVCDFNFGGGSSYTCVAWPQKAGVGYSWSLRGNVQFANPPYLDETAVINCSPSPFNKVYLTATSPYGMSTTVEAPLYCGASGEY